MTSMALRNLFNLTNAGLNLSIVYINNPNSRRMKVKPKSQDRYFDMVTVERVSRCSYGPPNMVAIVLKTFIMPTRTQGLPNLNGKKCISYAMPNIRIRHDQGIYSVLLIDETDTRTSCLS
jgi:hypothetical protein